MKVSEAISTKRAVRNFSDKPISRTDIAKIINAGRRAQSSKNTQPWDFIVITEKDLLKKLSGMGTYAGHIENAVMAVAIITPPPEQRFSIMFDAGQAAGYMQLAAWELGIGSCLATIYQPDETRELLGFPKDLEIRIAISFGYQAEENSNPRIPVPDGRKKLEQVIHWEKW